MTEGYWFAVLFLDGSRETQKIVAIVLHFFLTILMIFSKLDLGFFILVVV
jgi:hypothetical protein